MVENKEQPKQEVQRLELPRECFQNMTHYEQISSESDEHWMLDRLEWDIGVHLYLKGAQFPLKGFVTPEMLAAANVVKSLFIQSIKILSQPFFLIAAFFTFLSKKRLSSNIFMFNYLAWRVISPHILKDRYLTTFSKELHWCLFTFLKEIGIKEDTSDRFSTIFVHLIEYDNAYRLRIEDIMTETSTERLKSPINEIRRLLGLIRERDSASMTDKIEKLVRVVSLIFFIPRFRKAWNVVLSGVNLKNLQLDDIDGYWACMRTDYKFMGKTLEERAIYAQSRGWEFPKKVEPK